MKNLTLEHIADCCHGTYIGPEEQRNFEVTGVVIDSRKAEAGNLFVAIKGERVIPLLMQYMDRERQP